MKIGDWIHDDAGVGKIIKFDGGVPMIAAGNPGHGFHCYHARPATAKEIEAAKRSEYLTDTEAPAPAQPTPECNCHNYIRGDLAWICSVHGHCKPQAEQPVHSCENGYDKDCHECQTIASQASSPQPAQPIENQQCSCTSEHVPHTWGGRPMRFCKGVDPVWRKCPQCGREFAVATWEKFLGKCPNCGDLFEKESAQPVAPPAEPSGEDKERARAWVKTKLKFGEMRSDSERQLAIEVFGDECAEYALIYVASLATAPSPLQPIAESETTNNSKEIL